MTCAFFYYPFSTGYLGSYQQLNRKTFVYHFGHSWWLSKEVIFYFPFSSFLNNGGIPLEKKKQEYLCDKEFCYFIEIPLRITVRMKPDTIIIALARCGNGSNVFEIFCDIFVEIFEF